MSKRFELINFLNAHDNFKDNKNDKKLDSFDVVELLNHYDKLQTLLVEKDQQIAELEEQLKECVRPKFKIGQEVYWIDTRVNSFNEPRYRIESYLIDSIVITSTQFRYYGDDGLWLGDDELFATEQEAQAKLKELGEKE